MPVYVLLHDDYADWELGYLLPGLVSPPPVPEVPKATREVVTFGLTAAPVRSMGGLRVTPDATLDDVHLEAAEALILPGGTFWKDFDDERLDALVRGVVGRKVLVGAICAATGYLAQLGLLDEVDHTSNNVALLEERAPSYAGHQRYKSEPVVLDRMILTASGLGAVDFTDKLLRHFEVYPPAVCEMWYRAFKHGEDPEG